MEDGYKNGLQWHMGSSIPHQGWVFVMDFFKRTEFSLGLYKLPLIDTIWYSKRGTGIAGKGM